MIFETRIRRMTFSLSPFSAEAMSNIAGTLLNSAILPRIRSGVNLADSRARPLTAKYALAKQIGRRVAASGGRKFSGQPIRDLTLRGWTLASARVKVASENRATIGFITPQAVRIITANNRLEPMWGVSPHDQEVLDRTVHDQLTEGAVTTATGRGYVLVSRSAA